MSKWRFDKAALTALHRYREDIRGTMSVELVLVLPMLFWAYVAMVVFYDAYRARMEAQAAALHVADLVSRQSQTVTTDYLDGMNDVYDFLTTRNRNTRLRISSIMWVEDQDDPQIAWSYGTRGLPSLLDLSLASFGGTDGDDDDAPAPSGFSILENQMPVADLVDRIPQVLPGEALILVEAFTLWRSPIISWMGFDYLNHIRFTPLAVTRPRFSPFIRYEGDNDIYPESPPDTMPPVGDPPPPEEEEVEPEPENTTVTIVNTDFNDGNTENWSTTTVTQTYAGSFLGPFGRETWNTPVTYQVNLGQTSASAVIEFDLFIIDSWDGYRTSWAHPEGEFLTIRVNGTSIALEAFNVDLPNLFRHNRRTVSSRAEGRFTTTMELIRSDTNLYGAGWNDQVWRVRIEVENPATQFSLGFSARLDEDIFNESFGFRRFSVIAERGDHGPAHFVPNAATRLGEDPLTRFTSYSGCPDRRIPAVNMTLRNSDVAEPLRMQRRAGGTSWAGSCGITGADRYVRSSPSMVLNYNNDTSDVSGNRLRIRTQDNNSGNTCDASLLIRDPYGQWFYNDTLSSGTYTWWGGWTGMDYNAQINLGHAATGEYHIWMGMFDSGSCATDLRFERY